MKYSLILISLLTALHANGQINFTDLIDATGGSKRTEFINILLNSGFSEIKEDQPDSARYDLFGYEYDKETKTASIWVYVFKNDEHPSIEIQTSGNPIFNYLAERIDQFSEFNGIQPDFKVIEKDRLATYRYTNRAYLHSSEVEFRIYSDRGSNYIRTIYVGRYQH